MINQYIENPTEALKMQKAIGIRIAPHLHTSAEMIYVEEGSATLVVGSLEYTIQRGDFAYIMPSNLHSIIPDTYQTSIFVVNCKTDLIENMLKKFNGCRPASPVLRSHDVPRDLPYALASLANEENEDIARSWLNLVFTLLCCNLRFANITEGATSDLSSRILSYLGGHYREPLSLDDLANAMGVSRFHLSHMFATKFGIGFKEYLNNLRIECAKGLLRSTDMPISEVCLHSGFENQRTFNRVFNENTGISPRDYRYGKSESIKKGKGKLRPNVAPGTMPARNVERILPNEGRNTAPKTYEQPAVDTITATTAPTTPFTTQPVEKTTTKTQPKPKEVTEAAKNTTSKTTPKKKIKEIEVPATPKREPESPLDRQPTSTPAKRSKTAVWLL